jgi:Tat protein translocase TatB subunit
MFLFILDSVGSSELLVILGAALIFFGPRRLPQLSRQLGRSLSEFRRASEDFKRTWEREVNMENLEKGIDPGQGNSILDKATDRLRAAREAAALDSASVESVGSSAMAPSVTPIDPSLVQPHSAKAESTEPNPAEHPLTKHDWL